MANLSKANLLDKDIRKLPIQNKRYIKAVGNPKELYIFVYPSGNKTFMLKFNEKYTKINAFRENLYSVAEARRDALKILKELESGKDINTIMGKDEKYLYKNLFNTYINQKIKNGISQSYIAKITKQHQNYILPSFGNKDIKTIKYSDIFAVLNAIFNPNNPRTSRLETIHRLINDIDKVFSLAQRDEYITYNPSKELHRAFPTASRFTLDKFVDTRLPALTDKEKIKEFIIDLKMDNKLDLSTKRAIYLQILCVNRPFNTVSAKWSDIDLENKIWTIPANQMKTKSAHEITLSSYALKILKEQHMFKIIDSPFVFPALNANGHLHRDTISKAIRNLGGKNRYSGIATSHGFRATFRTICSKNKAELLNLGISEEAIESVLAHKELNAVKRSYERDKATIEQKARLMQWYGDYLNSIEPLGI